MEPVIHPLLWPLHHIMGKRSCKR